MPTVWQRIRRLDEAVKKREMGAGWQKQTTPRGQETSDTSAQEDGKQGGSQSCALNPSLTNNELLAFVQLCGRASGHFSALTQCRVGLHFWAAVKIGFEGGHGVDGAPVGEW